MIYGVAHNKIHDLPEAAVAKSQDAAVFVESIKS